MKAGLLFVELVIYREVHVAVSCVGVILRLRDGSIRIGLVEVEAVAGRNAAHMGVARSAVGERADSHELELVHLFVLVPRHGDVALNDASIVLVKGHVSELIED